MPPPLPSTSTPEELQQALLDFATLQADREAMRRQLDEFRARVQRGWEPDQPLINAAVHIAWMLQTTEADMGELEQGLLDAIDAALAAGTLAPADVPAWARGRTGLGLAFIPFILPLAVAAMLAAFVGSAWIATYHLTLPRVIEARSAALYIQEHGNIPYNPNSLLGPTAKALPWFIGAALLAGAFMVLPRRRRSA